MHLFKQKILTSTCVTYSKVKRLLSNYESNHFLFKDYFGLPENKAKDYVQTNRLSNIPTETIMRVVRCCEGLGFTKTDMLMNPMILRTHPISVNRHYNVMTEGGFRNINITTLARFRSFTKKNVYALKDYGFINPETNVAESFIKYLDPCPKDFYVKTDGDLEVWSKIHLKVFTEYLKWRFQVNGHEISEFLAVYSRRIYCFKDVCENIALALELGFTYEKILKYGYILHSFPKYAKELLEKYPVIAGVCMKKAMRMYPKLMTACPASVERIYNTLKEHNIPDQAIARRLNIFYLSPDTVEFRLKELKRVPDFKVLLHNPNILRLVVHHNRAKSRLSFLKELQLKCATVSLLGADVSNFDNLIKEGKDVNTFMDTYAFLKGKFSKEWYDFEATLRRHPYYLHVPLTTMEETYSYLISEKFTNESIIKVIYVLLYPKEKIQNAFKLVKEYEKSNSKRMIQVNRLNLALYFIEKEHHFTGDGIWMKFETSDENVYSS